MADFSSLNTKRKRVLSGMRPTGKLHLGNYMGALYNWVKLQNEVDAAGNSVYECYFFIADWHALTTDYADPSRIKQNTLDVILDYLAAGLDPQKSVLFVQSHVPQHAELHLLLSMITPLSWLERVPSFKDQQEQLKEKDLATYGFLGYPLLQSADILIYQPDFVPVGQDQVAHVELTREVARRFNSMYKTRVLPEPEALLTPSPKLPGIDGRKMSKSYGNTIGLTEAPATVAQKVHTMSTNGQRIRQSDPGNPDLCPVGDLHKVFSSAEMIAGTQKGCRTATIRCEVCKIEAGRSVCAVTEPISTRRQELELDVEQTWELLREQAAKAEMRAEKTMVQVRTVLNLTRDLGALQRRIRNSATDLARLRDLSSRATEWWDLPSDQRGKLLREYWQSNILPYDIPLTMEANRNFATVERELEEPLLTAKSKRVLITAIAESQGGWHFRVPARSYEVWTLLCWERAGYSLQDLVIPQSLYAQAFAQAKRSAKETGIQVLISKHAGKWGLQFVDLNRTQSVGNAMVGQTVDPIDVTPFLGNYKPLL